MKILILGGTGAIGISLVDILADKGNKIYVTSRRTIPPKKKGICYIKGDAHNLDFMVSILKENYDVIIDFMSYLFEEFENRYELLLSSTSQYIFLSSARVYAESEQLLTEESARLIDTIGDKQYLSTREYALEKAREEILLINSRYKNWTIVRPYITYNIERLQLGVLEKEHWLYRALHGRTIVFSEDIADKITTLIYGYDVALRISKLIGNKLALEEIYQITAGHSIKWKMVLKIYLDTLQKLTGNRPNILMIKNSDGIANILGNYYQIKYDRMYNRIFDSSKINKMIENKESYKEIEDGLKMCITEFYKGKRKFREISWKLEVYFDRQTKERVKFTEIPEVKQKLKYLIYRYTPILEFRKGK